MALYFPQQQLAVDIVDDPCSAPVESDVFPNLVVIPMTCAEIERLMTSGASMIQQIALLAKDKAAHSRNAQAA